MIMESRLRDLLLQWEELRAKGQAVSAADLCRDCPELIAPLEAQISALQAVDRMLVSESPPARGTLNLPNLPEASNTVDSHSAPTLPPPRQPGSQPAAANAPRSWAMSDLKSGIEPVPGYVLVERLGMGGFGEVWKATAPGGFPIAMKFVSRLGQGVKVEMRALEIIKALRHPNLLATFGTWQIPGLLVIAMELGDRTLCDRFKEAVAEGLPGIPRDELLEYLQEAAKGIDYLNEPQHVLDGKQSMSVQHRDIKPQNILLVGRGVKVADFGLVRMLEHAVTAHTGSMTPGYAAPEFMRGRTSSRSDQYSLAAMYCELRGGRLPFQGSVEQVLFGHLEGTPDLSMLPEEERPIASRALAKDPEDRWPSCRDFVAALAGQTRVSPNLKAGRKKIGGGSHWPSRALLYLATATVFGLLALVAFEGGQGPQPDPLIKKDVADNHEEPSLAPASDVPATDSQVVIREPPAATTPEATAPAATTAETTTPEVKTAAVTAPAATTPNVTIPDVAIVASNPPNQVLPEKAKLEIVPQTETPTIDTARKPAVEPIEVARALPAASAAAAAATPIAAPDFRVGELQCFRGHRDWVRSVAFSPVHPHSLSAGDDHVVRLWDVDTGLEVHRFEGHSATVNCVAFSPDGRRAISGGEDAAVWLWDVDERTRLRQLVGHSHAVFCVAFSSDGSRALSAGQDATVRLWNVETGMELQRIDVPGVLKPVESIFSVAFGPDNRQVLVANDSPLVRLYNLETGDLVKRLTGHTDVVWSVAFSQKTGRALTSSGDHRETRDYTVRLWDVDRGSELLRFDRHTDAVGSVAIFPDGRRGLSGSADRKVRLWNLESGEELHCFEGHEDVVECVAFSPDGRRAVSASKDGTVRVWGLPK